MRSDWRLPHGYYDLLMDIQMPVIDGYEAARLIRDLNRPDAYAISIIALIANAFAHDIYAAKQAGMNMHLAKPLDVKQMMSALGEWRGERPLLKKIDRRVRKARSGHI